MTHHELELLFKDGSEIRGPAERIKPTFMAKLRLLFSKNFKVKVSGKEVRHTFYGKLKAIFSKKFELKKEGAIVGMGQFETRLIDQGLKKAELKRLVDSGKLRKVTCSHRGAWRNTYVLPMGDKSK